MIDHKHADLFLFTLDELNEQHTFQILPEAKGCRVAPEILHGTHEEHKLKLTRANEAGAGIYITVNACDGQGRKAENVTRVRAFYQDDDAGDVRAPIEPSIIVETSPGKQHLYYLTDDTPVDQYQDVQKALVDNCGGDRNAVDISRVLRLPGYMHRKGDPFVVKMIHESGQQPHSFERVKEAIGPYIKKPDLTNGAFIAADHLNDGPVTRIREILSGGNFHDNIVSLAARYSAKGLGMSEVVSMIQGWMQACNDGSDRWRDRYESVERCVRSGQEKFAQVPVKATKDSHDMTGLDELLAKQFPPIFWHIDNVVPAGTTLMFGKPKKGKSFLALSMALRIASGQAAFGRKTSGSPVLFLGLEDNMRRLQSRTLSIIQQADLHNYLKGKVTFATLAPRIDAGLIGLLDEWLQANGQQGVIVIDMLKKITGEKRGGDIYKEQAHEGDALTQWCKQYPKLSVIVIHHSRKAETEDPFDALSGTTGLSGSYDNLFAVQDEAMFMSGRDLECDELPLESESGVFTLSIAGESQTVMSNTRHKVLEVLSLDPMNPQDIADQLGMEIGAVKKILKRMLDDGQVQKPARGKYTRMPF